MRPCRSRMPAIAPSIAAASVTSSAIGSARPPAAVIAATVSSRVLATRRRNHRRALRGQTERNRPADAAGRTGDEGDALGEIDHGRIGGNGSVTEGPAGDMPARPSRAPAPRRPRGPRAIRDWPRGHHAESCVPARSTPSQDPLQHTRGRRQTQAGVTTSCHRTGAETCATSASIDAPAPWSSAAASTLAITGTCGSRARERPQFRREPFLGRLHQRAVERRAHRQRHHASARRAPSHARPRGPRRPRAPAITTCPGAFRLAGLTTSPSAASAHARAASASSAPRRAAIAPVPTGTASCMYRPRRRTIRTASAKSRVPATTCAEYSPRLWPATKAGSDAACLQQPRRRNADGQDGRLGVLGQHRAGLPGPRSRAG